MVHVHVHSQIKHWAPFYFFFLFFLTGAVQHMFNLLLAEISNSSILARTEVLPCPKAFIPRVLPLGFAAGTTALGDHVLTLAPPILPRRCIFFSGSGAPRREPWSTINQYEYECVTSV
jgi:hypothetical protein